jgi:molecular chaperone DnaK (HSP70)
MFGFPPSLSVNVDEAVALGAAVHAGMKKLQQTPNSVAPGIAGGLGGVKLTDVCNYSYGTLSLSEDALDGREKMKNSIILKKNSALPVSETQTFYTAREGQEQVNVTVTEGEGEEPEDVHVSHRQIFKLPPGRPANQPIEITYSYDTNQRMHCNFLDVESGRTLDLDFSIKGEKNIQVLDVKQASKEMKAFSVE